MESRHEQAVSAERARGVAESEAAQRAAEVNRLEKALEEEAVRGGLVEELRAQLESMEEQLGKLQAEVSGLVCTTGHPSLLHSPPSLPPSLPPSSVGDISG